MSITATKLRQNLYSILDEIIETGIPVSIIRKGHKLKIVALDVGKKIDRLEEHLVTKDDPESFVHIDWSETWKGDIF